MKALESSKPSSVTQSATSNIASQTQPETKVDDAQSISAKLTAVHKASFLQRTFDYVTANMRGIDTKNNVEILHFRRFGAKDRSTAEAQGKDIYVRPGKNDDRWLSFIAENCQAADQLGYSEHDIAKQITIAYKHSDHNGLKVLVHSLSDSLLAKSLGALDNSRFEELVEMLIRSHDSALLDRLISQAPQDKLTEIYLESPDGYELRDLLDTACMHDCQHTVKAVLDKLDLSAIDCEKTLRECAIDFYPSDTMKMLLEAGILSNVQNSSLTATDVLFDVIGSTNYENFEPSRALSSNNQTTYIDNALAKMQFLLDYGACIDGYEEIFDDGIVSILPLISAATLRYDKSNQPPNSENAAIINFLLDHGANPYLNDKDGHDPLWHSRNNVWTEVGTCSERDTRVTHIGHPAANQALEQRLESDAALAKSLGELEPRALGMKFVNAVMDNQPTLFKRLVDITPTEKLIETFKLDQVVNQNLCSMIDMAIADDWLPHMYAFLGKLDLNITDLKNLNIQLSDPFVSSDVTEALIKYGLLSPTTERTWATNGLLDLLYSVDSLDNLYELMPFSDDKTVMDNLIKKMQIYLDYGADINGITRYDIDQYNEVIRGKTHVVPLIYAAILQYDKGDSPQPAGATVVKFLLEQGANPYLRDVNGKDALWYAKNHTWTETDFESEDYRDVTFTGHPAAKLALEQRHQLDEPFLVAVKEADFYPFIEHWKGNRTPTLDVIKSLPTFEQDIESRPDWQELLLHQSHYANEDGSPSYYMPSHVGQSPYEIVVPENYDPDAIRFGIDEMVERDLTELKKLEDRLVEYLGKNPRDPDTSNSRE